MRRILRESPRRARPGPIMPPHPNPRRPRIGLDQRRQRDPLQRPQLGPRLLPRSTRRATSRSRRSGNATSASAGRSTCFELIGQILRRGDRDADPAALRRHPARARARAERGLQRGARGVQLRGALPRRLPDQGQPAAPRGRGAARGGRASTAWASRSAASPSCSRSIALHAGARLAHDLQRLQGRGLHRDGAASPASSASRRSSWSRSSPSSRRSCASPSELDIEPAIGVRTQARAASGVGPLAGLGRRPLEVRPDDAPDRARSSRRSRRDGMLDCLQAPALPHRQPDHRASARSRTRCARRRARSIELHKMGAHDRVLRRRRRPRRRLRRLDAPTSSPR